MVKRDLSSGLPTAGLYLVEVSGVELKRSKKGDQMLKIDLKDAETGSFLATDFFMLEGRGLWIGNKKLEAFGMDPKASEFDEYALIGRRAWASLDIEQRDGYEPRLAVNGKADGSLAGYWREADRPMGEAAAPISAGEAGPLGPGAGLTDETPF